MGQFGISQAVKRREDPRLLRGVGCFGDDYRISDCARALVLRSPFAHAAIRRINTARAMRCPGVIGIYTGADLTADGIGDINCLSKPAIKAGSEYFEHRQGALCSDTVRFVGDCVAFIIAETVDQARDALELIEVEYEPLPAVSGCRAAAQPGSAAVWPQGNTCYEFEMGDAQATAAAFARADHIISLDVVNNRVVLNALETRSAIGLYDADAEKFTLYTGTQMPHSTRNQLADAVFRVPREKIRLLCDDVGGGFGGKNSLYPEQILVLYAARKLKRAVKWIGERSEAFISDFHGRDNISTGELALDSDGLILGLRVSTLANLGAYTASRGTLSPTNVAMASNMYRVPALHINVHALYTNTVPTDPYRGAGRPEILYLIERLIDVAAYDLGIDRIELRRRNYIAPTAFPYRTPTGLVYEPCAFESIMEAALAQSDWSHFPQRRSRARDRQRLRGIGLANYVERCGGGGGLSESAKLSFAADGTVVLYIGTMANGQGHDTAYSQILNHRLGLPFEKIRIVQGDTDQVLSGHGTGGSWSIPMGGGATLQAADRLLAKATHLAGELLEASVADVTFDDGVFQIIGTDLSLSWSDLVAAQPDLGADAVYQPANHTFPYGCHICEVEIDEETGALEIIAYTAVHDFGRALNPLLLAGQVHGGLAQGIGQAAFEHTVYDAQGQLLSGSFSDYCLPRADDLPAFHFVHQDTPAPGNPLGVKGCGEAGAAGSPPALINAIVDALGIRHIDMPATQESIWRMLCQRKNQNQ